jgi:hypothetical protein
LWYPASGDSKIVLRPLSEAEAWQRTRAAGGLPVFWQSYLEKLPSSLIRGGKLASSGTKYPIIYVAVPQGQNPEDFGYLFEDLASRGFLVAAGVPLPGPLPPRAAFSWSSTWAELTLPFQRLRLWLEPEASDEGQGSADYRWLIPTREALRQLDTEPGDLLFDSVDWSHQGLWAWGGQDALPSAVQSTLGLRGIVQAGGRPSPEHRAGGPELWIIGAPPPGKAAPSQWFLTLPRLHRADLADSAYLKPYLAFFGLKSQADAGVHGALRQYQAAFFQYAFWASGNDVTFGQSVPEVPGLILSGK